MEGRVSDEGLRPRSASILVIGDEILSGKVVDEIARLLIAELRELGVALRRILVIPDVLDEIAEAVREVSARYDYVFTSGGVGPTHDDVTVRAEASAKPFLVFQTRPSRHTSLTASSRNGRGRGARSRRRA